MADATYHFLSFVRSGFAASIDVPDTFSQAQPALAAAPVGVSVSGTDQPVVHRAVVRGPGDVIGISASQVIRTDPVDGAVGTEPNYFAQIEFDRPDLPWLFTPAAAVGEQLRPWVVLVVVDAEGPAACQLRPGSPLPVLAVPAAAAHTLPSLAESSLWAHAQVILPNGVTLQDALGDHADPRLTVSRLLCPRHLSPNRWYTAAVVPAFNVGRLAGLGLGVTPEEERQLNPAWQPGAAVDLPVYYSWQFRTGEDADFEGLVRKLRGRPLPDRVGTRTLDVSRPGFGLPPQLGVQDPPALSWLDGALRPIESGRPPLPDDAAFRASLTVLLDRPADQILAGHADPIVAPPIYGDKHAMVVKLGGAPVPPWISELNLDPRLRVAAGLGTQVIQARQEDYAARAWRQLGDVLAANRLLRRAQFARSSAQQVHGRLGGLDPAALLTLAYPVHSRVVGVLPSPVTLTRALSDSRLPGITVQPAFRRVTRSSSAVGRAAGPGTLGTSLVKRFAEQAFVAPTDGPDGSVSMRPASSVIGAARASEILTGLNIAQPGESAQLDTMLASVASAAQSLPSGAALRALARRNDVGAVALLSGLGAVSASAVSAVLSAASPVTPLAPPVPGAPAAPPPILERQPPVDLSPLLNRDVQNARVPRESISPLASGLAGEAAPGFGARLRTARNDSVFVAAGPTRNLSGEAVLRGGSVTIDSDVVRRLTVKDAAVQVVDDARWATLQQHSGVPAILQGANPISDVGTRLDAFRRDPVALLALAQVAAGDAPAALLLDARSAPLLSSAAAATTLAGLAEGRFVSLLPTVRVQVLGASDLTAASTMYSAVALALDRVVLGTDAPAAPLGPTVDLAVARAGLLVRLDPALTVPTRVRARLTIDVRAGVPRRDELDPVMASPHFNDPMWKALRDVNINWLLPGLDKVLPDTATLVRTNPTFVTAHMIGLNHEMMRELLWREFPTDQRGTPFRRFWGRTAAPPDDIPPVHQFRGGLLDSLLAGNDPDGEAVLLLRSELLRRYPGSLIYLCRRIRDADGHLVLDDATLVLPSFRGDLPPDVSFIGFPVTPTQLRAVDNPWYFVIAQPPSEPRFGLDDWTGGTPARPDSSNDLSWSHMTPGGLPDPPAPFAVAAPPVLNGVAMDPERLLWGQSAAVQAHLTYQHPVRVAIRAAELMPPLVPPPVPPPVPPLPPHP